MEGIPREGGRAAAGPCKRTGPSSHFDQFGPFLCGNDHGVKRPGCTPTPPPSRIIIQMLACTPGRSTHHPKSHGTDGGASLSSSWSGVGCPSICPPIHTRPQGGASPQKMCFSVISPPHSLAMGRWLLSNELLGASHSCSYKYIDFFFPFSLKHNASIFLIYIYIYILFFFWLLSPPCG